MAIPTVAIVESEMSLHASQENKLSRTNSYSKSGSGKDSRSGEKLKKKSK